MSTPYDPNQGRQQNPADATPTQFVQSGQIPQQPQYGQAPQFGAPAPQQAQQPTQAFGAPPAQPQFGQQPQGAPAWGQGAAQPTQPFPDPNANPYAAGNPYPQYGTPAQPPKQRGRGFGGFLAVAVGTVLGRVVLGLLVVGGIAAYHFATADPAQRNSTGQVSQSGSMDATDLQIGDCFDAPSGTSGISSIKAVPCSQSHDSQVYAEPQISEDSYPGDSTLQKEAETDCGSDSAQSVISSDAPSSAQIADYFPQDADTFSSQRYIICALESDSVAMTQSYVSSASSAS
ncbi:MAG TPA: hypothetical protein VL551_30105 [Actinospica sp.]|nr:hypothetical protein [Actinospica sp.]